MMYAQPALPLFDPVTTSPNTGPSTGSFSGLSEPYGRSSYVDPACVSKPRFVRSVAQDAGLGSFAYLRGTSGKRYVFSAVRGNQISLYENAVFAVAGTDGSLERVVTRNQIGSLRINAQLYVHLLDDKGDVFSDVVADMTGV